MFRPTVELSARKGHCYKYDCGLLGLHHWSWYQQHGIRIMFTISDDDDHLEWVCSETIRDKMEFKIPRSSIYHRISVTATVLEEDLMRAHNVDTEITRDFRIIAKRTVTAIDWPPVDSPYEEMYSGLSSLRLAQANVLDLRPRIRRSVVMTIDDGPTQRLFEYGTHLPAEQSISFSSGKSSVCVELFHEVPDGNEVNISSLEQLDFALSTGASADRQGSLRLVITEDGTVVATCTFSELKGYERTLKRTVERCIEVIGPKIAVDGGGHLSLQHQPGEDSEAVAAVCIAYDAPASVDRWLISITKATDPSVGRIFSVPASGPSLQFLIPFDDIESKAMTTDNIGTVEIDVKTTDAVATYTMATGIKVTASYEYFVEVCGLRLLDKEDGHDVSMVLCKAVAMVTTPAKGVEVSRVQDIKVEINRRSFHEVMLCVPSGIPTAEQWTLTIEKLSTPRAAIVCPKQFRKFETPVLLDDQKFEVPVHFQAGCTYGLMVEGIFQSATVYRGLAEFRAENTVDEIRTLYEKALAFASEGNYAFCRFFYRNKSPKYFEDILNHGGIMRAYDKDNSGDPANPINHKVKGLFFAASVADFSTTGEPRSISPFGSARLLVPASDLLAMASNVYFADFFCMGSRNGRQPIHYVTLVLTKTGSEVDRFCAERLMRIDINDPRIDINDPIRNPFLFRRGDGQLMVSTRDRLLVEVIFTLDLNIGLQNYDIEQNIATFGHGTTTPGGLPKVSSCAICNLLSPAEREKFQFF